jgi:hypothetical protein
MYTRAEVDVILRIKELLYKEGFTIAGAKKKLEQEMTEPVAPASAAPVGNLDHVKRELRAILAMLKT